MYIVSVVIKRIETFILIIIYGNKSAPHVPNTNNRRSSTSFFIMFPPILVSNEHPTYPSLKGNEKRYIFVSLMLERCRIKSLNYFNKCKIKYSLSIVSIRYITSLWFYEISYHIKYHRQKE